MGGIEAFDAGFSSDVSSYLRKDHIGGTEVFDENDIRNINTLIILQRTYRSNPTPLAWLMHPYSNPSRPSLCCEKLTAREAVISQSLLSSCRLRGENLLVALLRVALSRLGVVFRVL